MRHTWVVRGLLSVEREREVAGVALSCRGHAGGHLDVHAVVVRGVDGERLVAGLRARGRVAEHHDAGG